MKKQIYVGVVTVKIKTPQGYRPSTLTYKFGFLLDKRSEKLLETIKAEHIDNVMCQLEAQNPGVTLKPNATIELTPIAGFTGNYLEHKEK